jgi:hypothetical protein
MLPQVMVKPSDYPFWKGVMKVKDFFKKKRGSFVFGNGIKTKFGEDTGLGNTHLAHKHTSV